MAIRFIHTADIHLGKTYRNSPGEAERYEDFFLCLSGIVKDALNEKVDFVLICGDLFHEGHKWGLNGVRSLVDSCLQMKWM